MTIHYIKLDMDKALPTPPPTVTARVGDTTCTIVASLGNAGEAYIPAEDSTAIFVAAKPDRTLAEQAATINGSTLEVELDPQFLAAVGEIKTCYFSIANGGEIDTTQNMRIKVIANAEDDTDFPSEDYVPGIVDSIQAASAAVQVMQADVDSAIAEAGAATTAANDAAAEALEAAGIAGSGIIPIERGGTGATTAVDALANLGAFPSAGGTISGDTTFSEDAIVEGYLRAQSGLFLPPRSFIFARKEDDGPYHAILNLKGGMPVFSTYGYSVQTGESIGAQTDYRTETFGASLTFNDDNIKVTGDILNTDGTNGFALDTDAIAPLKPVRTHFMLTKCNTALSLTTAGTAIDMTGLQLTNSEFFNTKDNGIECLLDGYVSVSAVVFIENAQAWDTGAAFIRIARSSGGVVTPGGGRYVAMNADGEVSLVIEQRVFDVYAGDVVNLYAYNATAARGSVPANGRTGLFVQYV